MDNITSNSNNRDDSQADLSSNNNNIQIPGPVGETAADTQSVPVNNNQSTDSNQNQSQSAPSNSLNIDDLRSKINGLSTNSESNSNSDVSSQAEDETSNQSSPEINVPISVEPSDSPRVQLEPTIPPENNEVASSVNEENTSDQKETPKPQVEEEKISPPSSPGVIDPHKKEIFAEESEYRDLINNDILDLIGLKDLPEAEKNEMYKKMLDTIQNRALMNVLDLLPDEKHDEFNEKLDTQNTTEINKFLDENGIDMEKIMLEESLVYKAEMVELQKATPKSE